MSLNVGSPDVKQISLTTFSGLVTNINPIALPQGSSPLCNDTAFLPGGVSSRPCFQKVFAAPFGTVTVTYAKTYVDPSGIVRNIYLDSSGNIWVENFTSMPGIYALLATTTPGSYAKSVTCFGREYLAVSDLMHGQEVPLQITGLPDGTVQLDRVTQDAPGAPPSVVSIAIPSVALASSGSPSTIAVTSITPSGFVSYDVPDGNGGFNTVSYYTTITAVVASGASGLTPFQSAVTFAGNSNTDFNQLFGVSQVVSDTVFLCGAFFPAGEGAGTGGTYTPTGSVSLQRQGNVVTATTAAAHQLQPGYQVQIGGVTAAVIGGGIASITVNNESNPGIATVVTNAPHGLLPANNVTITGVSAAAVGTSISSIVRSAQVVTVVMAAATGLGPGALITVAGVTPATFNGIWQVLEVTTTSNTGDTFTYAQVDTDATGNSGGTVSINWPIPNAPTPTYFQVLSSPSATSFQVQLDYSDGVWTSGAISFAWNGTFFVQTVPNATGFTYQQYGPNATATYASGQIATPYGQVSPGIHQCSVAFLRRQGNITNQSPPVQFEANGGQYVSISNLAIGPPDVIARIILFTGAGGAYYFYISSPPQENGQLVGTSTQVNDNATTSVILDFADATLLSSTGVSVSGNNIANQIVLDSAIAFGFYGSRLNAIGPRNTVQNLVNTGFDGGYSGNATTIPLGWNASLNSGGALTAGHLGLGQAWSITVSPSAKRGELTQSAYQDYTGSPILTGSTPFLLRVWLQPSAIAADLTFTVALTSASASFSSTVAIGGNTMNTSGSWFQIGFTLNTPSTIPSDMTLSLYARTTVTTLTLVVDELNLIFGDDPYQTGIDGSYVNNPEAFDGVTGLFGPVDDTHAVIATKIIRGNLYMLTLDPGGRLHETSQGTTEPAGWVVDEVASECGILGPLAITESQADDSTASGGEEWFTYGSATGFRIFGGEYPHKISQEIQRPNGVTFPGAPNDLGALNTANQQRMWALNDPQQKLMWFGIPSGVATAPNVIWAMNYLGLESAEEIASGAPVHLSLSGKMVTRDLARKWAPWNIPMNGGALMIRQAGALTPVFFGGSGSVPAPSLSGTCNTINNIGPTTLVTRVSGSFFSGLQVGTPIVVNGVSVVITSTSSTNPFLGGNQIDVSTHIGTHSGVAFTTGAGSGNVYTLNPGLYTDDDYGQIFPQYATYAFPDRDQEQQLQLGGFQKMIAYSATFISGVGYLTITALVTTLANAWTVTGSGYLLKTNPTQDLEWQGGQATGPRFFILYATSPNAAGSTPSPATDNQFSIASFTLALKMNRRYPVTGSY